MPSINFKEFNPSKLSLIVRNENKMPDPNKPGTEIRFKYVDLMYKYQDKKEPEALIFRTPIVKSRRGLNKNEKKKDEPQPMIQGYQHPMMAMMQPQQMQQPAKKQSAMLDFNCCLNLNKSEPEQEEFIGMLKLIRAKCDELLYPHRGSVYNGAIKEGVTFFKRGIEVYPKDLNGIEDETANPTIWAKVKKYPKDLSSTFLIPCEGNKSKSIDYKLLIDSCIEGVFFIKPRIFAGSLNVCIQASVETAIITDIKTSELAEEASNLAGELSLDTALCSRLQEGICKITALKENAVVQEQEDTEKEKQEKTASNTTLNELPPQSVMPTTYQTPNTVFQPTTVNNPMITPSVYGNMPQNSYGFMQNVLNR